MPAVNDKTRSYAAAHFALELDSLPQEQATVRSIEGGGVKLDVMTYQQGGVYDRWKQIGKPKFDDIKMQVAATSSNPLYAWIQQFFLGQGERRNGAIVAADFYYAERARREFKEGMITELAFPKLDANDKSSAYINVTVAVEDIQFKPGSGSKLQVALPVAQNLWTCCNFIFELESFDCTMVTKVDGFSIKHTPVEYHSGGRLSPTKTQGPVEFPNLSFSIPESVSQQFADYVTNKGKIAYQGTPRTSPLHGRLVALDAQHRELFYLTFTGADVFSVTPDTLSATSEEIKQVKVEVYVEGMSFTFTDLNKPSLDVEGQSAGGAG